MLAIKNSWLMAIVLSAIFLGGCLPKEDKDEANNPQGPSPCSAEEQAALISDGRTLCLSLSTVATAPFMQGFYGPAKVVHRIMIKDENGSPVDVASDQVVTAVSQAPMMYMENGMAHTTPFEAAAINHGDGNYDLTTFYVMASMGGYWDYTVVLTDVGAAEPLEVTFSPNVEMVPMGSIYRSAELKNVADTITVMGSEMPRKYFVWLDSLSANSVSGHDLRLFVSTMDMAMMKKIFPAVSVGQTLHDASGSTFTVGSVSVQMSDNGAVLDLVDEGNGYYSATGLQGLTPGASNTISLALVVDGLSMQDAVAADPQLIFNVAN